jgi:phospholipid-binding lipoprotein MlaA
MSRIFGVIVLSFFIATSSMAGSDGQNELSKNTNGQVKDCFEKVNRGIFAFNQAIDGLIFEPLAMGYRKLPSPIRTGTSNFVGNISTLLTIPNNVLQGDIGVAGKNTLRFVVNTTIGIIGLFDPASAIGLNSYEKEDFGQTLGSWGVGEGCYVVLPVLGPSTARDAIGSLGNYMGGDAWYNVTVRNDTHYFSDFDYYASKGAGGVDFRAKNFDDINNLEENSVDFYASVKSLYLQDRRKRILNASGATQTQDDSDWEEID